MHVSVSLLDKYTMVDREEGECKFLLWVRSSILHYECEFKLKIRNLEIYNGFFHP
jgi:hypothetical protein